MPDPWRVSHLRHPRPLPPPYRTPSSRVCTPLHACLAAHTGYGREFSKPLGPPPLGSEWKRLEDGSWQLKEAPPVTHHGVELTAPNASRESFSEGTRTIY